MKWTMNTTSLGPYLPPPRPVRRKYLKKHKKHLNYLAIDICSCHKLTWLCFRRSPLLRYCTKARLGFLIFALTNSGLCLAEAHVDLVWKVLVEAALTPEAAGELSLVVLAFRAQAGSKGAPVLPISGAVLLPLQEHKSQLFARTHTLIISQGGFLQKRVEKG